jgi:hypothetical protein
MVITAAAAAATVIAAAASTAAVLVAVVTVGHAVLLRRGHIDDGGRCGTVSARGAVSAAVLGILVLGRWGRHLHSRLRALDVALLLGPISTATVAPAMIVGECLQRASAEQQARDGQRGDDRQSSGSGHYLPSGTTLMRRERGGFGVCYGQSARR